MSDWYKMDPRDWNTGTNGLSLELEAAYLRVCHEMYMTDGPIQENVLVLAGLFRCNSRKAERLLSELVEAGKLDISNGFISNRRAIEVISIRNQLRIDRKSIGIRGGIESGKARSKSLKSKEFNQPIASTTNELDKIRVDKTPSLRSGDVRAGEKFKEFWSMFPNKVGKGAAETAFSKALKKSPFEEIMEGLQRYVNKTDDRPWCNPGTFLNQERWADAPAAPVARNQPDTTLKALDRRMANGQSRPNMFDALTTTIDLDANRDEHSGGDETAFRFPAYSQRY